MSLFAHRGKVFSPDGRVDVDPADVDQRNAETSAKEVMAFEARAADKWFAYWHEGREIRNWIGAKLADVTWQGRPYKMPAFGRSSERVNFRAKGIDGREWSGTYYKSSGDYVRMRATPR